MAIHQQVRFEAPPDRIYAALTNADEFGKFTGAPTEIGAVEGGAFSCFGGQITGRIIELATDTRLVQAWRAKAWPEGVYTIVRITLEKEGGGTRLTLDQSGIPEGAAGHLEAGWHKMYWDPLRSHFA
jgi:activator of HSP90 ATPase